MMQGAPPQMMPPGPMGMGMGPTPMQGMAGPMSPMQQGMGYDQYLPPVMRRRRAPAMYRMPAPPPRFPTPGRMDGTRDYPGRSRQMEMY